MAVLLSAMNGFYRRLTVSKGNLNVFPTQPNYAITPKNFRVHSIINMTVVLGAHDTTIGSSDSHRETFELTPRDVTRYPNWYFPELEGDISVVKLPRKVSLNSKR